VRRRTPCHGSCSTITSFTSMLRLRVLDGAGGLQHRRLVRGEPPEARGCRGDVQRLACQPVVLRSAQAAACPCRRAFRVCPAASAVVILATRAAKLGHLLLRSPIQPQDCRPARLQRLARGGVRGTLVLDQRERLPLERQSDRHHALSHELRTVTAAILAGNGVHCVSDRT
jgi:hypothetical protein